MAAVVALGAMVASAQNPCEDAAGLTAADADVRELLKDKSLPGRKKYVEAGKAFVQKYGSCEPAKDFAGWLTTNLPKTEETIKKMELDLVEGALVARFDNALKTKNWDEVYVAGKEALAKNPEKYRIAEIVLAAVGGEEAMKNNFKYQDDALKYAKQSIADLEAGKPFLLPNTDKTSIGLAEKGAYNFLYPTKEDAIGWMNLYIGYITQVSQKNKAAAVPYLYKASQAASESAKNPLPFELIGAYYFDEVNRLVEEVKKLEADSTRLIDEGKKLEADRKAPSLTPEAVAELTKQIDEKVKAIEEKATAIKAKVALVNGTAERAMDAYSRAYTFATAPAYKAKMKKSIEDAYKLRKGTTDGMDAWIASAVTKPFPNPLTPVTPVSDAPVTTSSTTSSSIKP
jgi:hypothetical protein